VFYHVVLEITPNSPAQTWWNLTADELRADVLVPFVNRQVIETSGPAGAEVFNMASASFVLVLKTAEALEEDPDQGEPSELSDMGWRAAHNCTAEFLGELKVIGASPDSRSLLQHSLSTAKRQIFVVMKFGDDELDSAYEGVMKPEGKRVGLTVKRIDEVQDSGRITDQMLTEIGRSLVVIADLTGQRPNCYYEAGFAHALGKELILTMRQGEDPHFDLAGYRFIRWKTESDLRSQLRTRLKALKTRGVFG
jgi:nucleoside 2-deoxyribosyltransferase